MTAGPAIPDVSRASAVVMERHGLGWRVGVVRIAAGPLDTNATGHADERSAERAAEALADEHDLIVLRA